MRQVAWAVALSMTGGTMAGGPGHIEVIDPFVGEYSETYEGFFLGQGGSLPIFDGQTTMTFGFVTSGSTFQGSTISAHSGVLFAHATSPVEFLFDTPVTAFGGWFATNGGANGGTVDLYDTSDQLIDSVPLSVFFAPGPAPWTWNGWISDVPLGRVHVSGNGVLNGFLGVDDMQVTYYVPGPWGVFALAPLALGRRRRGSPARVRAG